MSSNPFTGEATVHGLDLNSSAITGEDHEPLTTAMAVEHVACSLQDSDMAGAESVTGTLTEGGGSTRKEMNDGSDSDQKPVMDGINAGIADVYSSVIRGASHPEKNEKTDIDAMDRDSDGVVCPRERGLYQEDTMEFTEGKEDLYFGTNQSTESESMGPGTETPISTASLEGYEIRGKELEKLEAHKKDLVTEGLDSTAPVVEVGETLIPTVEAESGDAQLVNGDSMDRGDLITEDVGVVDENLNGKGENVMNADLCPIFESKAVNLHPSDKNIMESGDHGMPKTSEPDEKQTVGFQEEGSIGSSLLASQEMEAGSLGTSANGSLGTNARRSESSASLQEVQAVQMSELEQEIPVVSDSEADVKLDAGTDGDQKVQVGEREQLERAEKQSIKRPIMRPSTNAMENDQRAHYYLPLQEDKAGFAVPDLVWGKVRSHPWWPGQIFDPKYASEMALKHQKQDHFLVAYFGDKTFAWCKESRLKPFRAYFSQMEKQSNMDVFVNAVNAITEEVSRRIELGMSCYCLDDETYANLKYQKVENAGIRQGTCSSVIDRSLIANSFQPDRLLEYIGALAQCPSGGADRLELVISKSQLKAFYRSKGHPELPVFLIGGGLLENDAEIPPSKSKKYGKSNVENSTLVASDILSGKRNSRGRESSSRKLKHILEDGRKKKSLSKLMEEEDVHHLANVNKSGSRVKSISRVSGKKHGVVGSDFAHSGRSKKKRLDLFGDSETESPSSTLNRSLKVGEHIRRVASQMKGSTPVLKSNDETLQNSVAKQNGRKGEVVGINNSSLSNAKSARKNRVASKEYSSSSAMLSQLCLAARDPMKGYSFLSMIISFFSDFRLSLSSKSSEDQKHVKSVGGKRGRKEKSVNSESASLEMSVPEYMQDSYWSDAILHSSPEREPVSRSRKRKGGSQKQRQKKKIKPVEEPSLSVSRDRKLDTTQGLLVGTSSPNDEQELAEERPRSNSVEKIEECLPTALILNFTESDALPSEADLVKIFSRYGPLKEAETEVLRKTNRAKVVFKSRADAEVAFSSAGKYSVFGSALVSYRLRYLQSSPKASPGTSCQDKKGATPTGNVELPAQEGTGVASDNT